MKKLYCTQNNGDCSTCSLVSYGRDCRNNPTWGGPREGAGRPKTSNKKAVTFWITDEEERILKECLEQIRNPSK